MSNTVIQIKRSQTTAQPGGLAEGELAYSGNSTSNSLFIGLPDGANTVTRIAGGKYAFLHQANTGNTTQAIIQGGKLTANAVMITDANSSIDAIRTSSLVINTSGNTQNQITSISTTANTTQLGANAGGSNTELVTSSAIKTYVDGKTAAIGGALANQQIAFSNGSVFLGSEGLKFDFATNTVSIANTLAIGANVTLNTSTLTIGSATVNASALSITNILGTTANLSSGVNVGANVNLSTTQINVGNTTVNTVITSSSISTVGSLTVSNNATFSNGINVSNTVISNVADPVNPKDAANKQYVDTVAEGLHVHPSVVAATPNSLAVISGGTVVYNNGASGVGATLTLSNPITAIDFVTLSTNNRILVKNEANTAHNGIYVYSNSTVLTRSSDFDTGIEIAGGDFLFVTGGNTYNSTGWVQIDEVTNVGIDAIVFEQFSGAGSFTAGSFLFLNGSEFNVNASSSSVASVVVSRDSNQNFSANVVTVNSIAAGNGQFTGPVSGITTLAAGNTTITGFANISSTLAAGNTTITGFANVSSTLAAGNTTVSGFINVSSTAEITGILTARANVVANGVLTVSNAANLGNTTITGFANVSSTLAAGNTTVTGFINVSSTANVGGDLTARANVTANGVLTVANAANLGNTTVTGFINVSSTANVGGILTARANVVANGQLIVSNTASLGNTTITGFANVTTTLAAGNTTITGFANVSSNVTVGEDLTVNGNTTIGSNSSDVVAINALVSTSIVPSANVTHDLGSAGLRFNRLFVANVESTIGNFRDVVVSGNLTVEGTLTAIDTDNLSIEDSLITLARNNTVDTLDIGFFGRYGTPNTYTGLFRDASDSGVYKFFQGLTALPTSTVDTANNTYTIATVEAYLRSGGLTTNSTAIAITANSTYSVTITANTITTGTLKYSTVTNQDILVANSSGNFVRLALGTDGQVLQSNGTSLVYGHLDGGTF